MTTTTPSTALDKLCIDTIRTLAMDAVQKANSGHPGTPMALAPDRLRALHARHAPQPARPASGPTATGSCSRAGHASMLLYSMLYLTGYGLELETSSSFRQLGSPDRRAPRVRPRRGHRGRPPGRSARASPTRSGIALAERMLAARFNRAATTSSTTTRSRSPRDGDIEEGVSGEAGVARRPPRARPPDRLLRRQPHLDRGRHGARASPRTSASATRPTAGTSQNLGEDIALDRLEEADARPRRSRTSPR